MKDLLSFTQNELKNLKVGLLILGMILLLSNLRPASEGIAELPIWQPKGRPAERSPNFRPPENYEGVWNDLGTVRFVSLDVLVVVFREIGGGKISNGESQEIHQAVNLAREFFWRNSNLQLNISPTFLEVVDPVSAEMLDEDGKIWPKSGLLEDELLRHSVKKNQYDVVFVLFPHPTGVSGGSGSGMQLKRLGKTAYSFSGLPVVGAGNDYPGGPSLTWIFARELWYSVNTIVYDHDPEEIEDWETLAATLRQYSIQDPPNPYGKIYLTVDFDRDGVPDDEPLVPFYEVSLGLNRETKDSDSDGLEDKRELTAGIFRGTDLFLKDTDGDGFEDGKDSHPLDPNLPVETPPDD